MCAYYKAETEFIYTKALFYAIVFFTVFYCYNLSRDI